MTSKSSILLFGQTGVGKSSLGNILLNDLNAFEISDKLESETKITIGKFNKNKDIFVIDTPGCQDSEGKDKEHFEQMIKYIKSQNDLKVILLVYNYWENENNEINKSNKKNLEIIKKIFKDIDIGKHLGIFFTHFYSKETDEATKKAKEELKIREINKIINSSEKNFPFFYGNILKGKEPKMETKVEILRIIKWVKSLDSLDVKNANQNAIEKSKNIEEDIQHVEKMEGDYIIKYDLVRKREVITYFDNTKKEGLWSEPEKKNFHKELNQELIKKKEKEKKEKEKKERLKREKEEEKERIRREKERLREEIESISVSDYYEEPPIYHRMNTFDNFNAPTFPVYRREFAGGNGQFTVNVGCNIF